MVGASMPFRLVGDARKPEQIMIEEGQSAADLGRLDAYDAIGRRRRASGPQRLTDCPSRQM